MQDPGEVYTPVPAAAFIRVQAVECILDQEAGFIRDPEADYIRGQAEEYIQGRLLKMGTRDHGGLVLPERRVLSGQGLIARNRINVSRLIQIH